jgi:hypothetical protein
MRRRNQLVDLLLDRIRPLVERLARDMAYIAAARIERELGRVSEADEVALSTYASDRPDLITAALGPQPLTAIEPLRRLKPKPEAVAAAKARIEERRARIRAQAESAQASTRRAAEPEVDDNPTAEERWSSERIEHAKTIAGSLKRDGELPVPRSTFEINQDGAMGDVIEVAPGGLAPWGQR